MPRQPRSSPKDLTGRTVEHGGYSQTAWQAARLLGVTGILEKMDALQTADKSGTLEYLLLRERLSGRIMLGLLQTSSTVAEITCERDRADQVADLMDEIDGTRVKGLTLASILFGGIGSIVSGGIALAGGATVASSIADVSSGTLTSAFGAEALFVKSEHVFQHARNLLAEIWAGPEESRLYPPLVWHFMHEPAGEAGRTMREELMEAWQQDGRLGEAGSNDAKQRSQLFFGPGGTYTASDLRARASMLETLEAKVRTINEYIEALVREIALVADAS